MPSSVQWTSILQATTIAAAWLILNHHVDDKVYKSVTDDPVFQSYWNATNGVSLSTRSPTPGRLALDTGSNASVINATNSMNTSATGDTLSMIEAPPESFYGRKLPREVVIAFFLSLLQYHWFIWMERLLPARPRRRLVLHEEKDNVEESEDREEKVIKKWIAQGRVRRASLNWCNTFLKWILTLTVGKILNSTLAHIVRGIFQLKGPKEIWSGLIGVGHYAPTSLRLGLKM